MRDSSLRHRVRGQKEHRDVPCALYRGDAPRLDVDRVDRTSLLLPLLRRRNCLGQSLRERDVRNAMRRESSKGPADARILVHPLTLLLRVRRAVTCPHPPLHHPVPSRIRPMRTSLPAPIAEEVEHCGGRASSAHLVVAAIGIPARRTSKYASASASVMSVASRSVATTRRDATLRTRRPRIAVRATASQPSFRCDRRCRRGRPRCPWLGEIRATSTQSSTKV